MLQILPSDLSVSINNTTFKIDEKSALDQCYEYINNGKTQMNAIKERLSQMQKDINISPLTIYNKINAENQQLQAILTKFNVVYTSVQKINVVVIAQQKECEKELMKIQTEKNNLESRLENCEKKLVVQLEQLDTVEKDFNKSCKTVKRAERKKKWFIFALIFLLYTTPICFAAMLVFGIYVIIKQAGDPSYQQNETIDKWGGIIFICLLFSIYPIYKKTCKSRKTVNTVVEEREIIAIKVAAETEGKNLQTAILEEVTHRLRTMQNLCDNQISKRAIFEEIINVLCNFQLTLKKWQEPLNKIINIYETQSSPSSNLKHIVERNQKNFTKKLLDILNNAQAVYCDI